MAVNNKEKYMQNYPKEENNHILFSYIRTSSRDYHINIGYVII